ncbi:EamA family transporter [Halomonas binhaiensis]|uniref:EamA family transporter n=1 Tax=Halomonas binhaiensis TaxID=2562282 RepID=A0A5C1NK03_9GAMM|nr:EamA family transporter [Halomonas binhaiensis]QEM83664.1 EamA family transporter [Halomonas binhaiensis]
MRQSDLILTALAPAVWGSTYVVTTEMLPPGHPLGVAMLRALPAGIILLLITRRLPAWNSIPRLLVLGALNFSLFWGLLFIAAYRLPGGVAATLGAVQPLMVLVLSRLALGSAIRPKGILAALAGLAGVALLILEPDARLDPVGVAAALGGAISMALGTVLTRKWQPDVSPLTFTAWQLTAGGLLLLPVALALEPSLPVPSMINLAGYLWLGLVGAALSYALWFRGIAHFGPATVTAFGFLSPLTAVVLGWLVLSQELSIRQLLGAVIILASVWLGQRAGRYAITRSRQGEAA